jgi:hypothetical protein
MHCNAASFSGKEDKILKWIVKKQNSRSSNLAGKIQI